MPNSNNLPRPRLGWLALFQLLVTALVVLMARQTDAMFGPPLLEDAIGPLSDAAGPTAGSAGRGWLPSLVAMVGALLLMLAVAWAYVATRMRKELEVSVVTTIVLLPIAVAAILVIVQDSLAVAFSLAGIAGLVRFRNALEDTRDAMYVVIAIAVGLGAGVGALEASAALAAVYNVAAVSLWKWNTAQPVIAEIALGEQAVPEGQTVLDALRADKERDPAPVAEWLEPNRTVPLEKNAPSPRPPDKRDGILRVRAADDIATRQAVEDVLEQNTKRWALETDDRGPEGLPTLTYRIRLKKRTPADALLERLRERLGPELAEYAPIVPAGGDDSSQAPA
jgi:hypothetical protein